MKIFQSEAGDKQASLYLGLARVKQTLIHTHTEGGGGGYESEKCSRVAAENSGANEHVNLQV